MPLGEPSPVLNDGCGCCSSGDITYRVVSWRQREDGVWVAEVLAARRDTPEYYIVWPEDKRE